MDFGDDLNSSQINAVNSFFSRVYAQMIGATLVAALCAGGLGVFMANAIQRGDGQATTLALSVQLGGAIGSFIVAWLVGRVARKGNASKTKAMLYILAALMGLGLASIVFRYSTTAIASGMLTGTIYFAVLTAFGRSTKRDLSGVGRQCFAALIALVIIELVLLLLSFFLPIHFGVLNLVINIASLVIFTGLTTYDTQQAKANFLQVQGDAQEEQIVATMAAVDLFLDFVNLVVTLIELFGAGGNDND